MPGSFKKNTGLGGTPRPIKSDLKSERIVWETEHPVRWSFMKILREYSTLKQFYPEINPYTEVYKVRDNVYALYNDSFDGAGDVWMYLVDGPEKALLVDTSFGVGDLKGLIKHLIGDKEIIVCNTHSHYDHCYGNAQFGRAYCHINEYNDIETLNMYKDRISKGYSHDEIMASIYAKGRDNARTPMQWDSTENAGFTTGKPWLKVNKNYKFINAEDCLQDKDSIFYHYKKLIDIRKHNDTIIYGDYKLLLPEDKNVFAYSRELNGDKIVVVCNFYNKEINLNFKEDFNNVEILLSNYKDSSILMKDLKLRPYEAIMYRVK